jgi:hypothetical protein
LTKKQIQFIESSLKWSKDKKVDLERVDKNQLQHIADEHNMKFPHFITRTSTYRVDRGFFRIPTEMLSDNKPTQKSAVKKKTKANDLSTTTVDISEKNKVKLAEGTSLEEEKEDVQEKHYSRKFHTNHMSSFNSYIVESEKYILPSLTSQYKKNRKDVNQVSGFHASSIIYRALADFETKCNFYIGTTKHSTKKEIKRAIIEDLETLKTNIENM